MDLPRKEKLPVYGEISGRILAEIHGPIVVEQLADQILRLRPSQACDSHQAALVKIRKEVGRQLVYLNGTRVLPLRLAYQGARSLASTGQ